MEPTDDKITEQALMRELMKGRPRPKLTLTLECPDTGIAHHLLVLHTALALYAEGHEGDCMPLEMAEALPDTLHILRDAVLDLVEVEHGGKKAYIGSTEFEGDRWTMLRRFLEFPGNWKPTGPDQPN